MKYKKIENKYLIRLERGERVVENLTKLCKDENINFGVISAIGGVDQATLGWYELSSKSYHWKDFSGNLEITSLTGNIALLDGQPFLHIHTVISDENYQAFGGHLKEATVAVTLEVVIEKLDGEIERQLDEKIGLNLIKIV